MTSRVLADRYELGTMLGSGGMATVYEAHDRLLGRSVAVKLLRAETLTESTARRRFLAEAQAAASLSHPHAVAVYDVDSSADEPFIVMELVTGASLRDVLADGETISEQQAIAVGSQVLGALGAAHERGLIHRDIKPANILLPDRVVPEAPDETPGVKLADFGIAKATRQAAAGLTATGEVMGTPRYISPEQIAGHPATPLSDLYATGLVLYEMLAGRPPFEADSAVGLMFAHRERQAPPLDEVRPDVDPAVVALIHQAMEKDPAARPTSAQGMRQALVERSAPPTILAAPAVQPQTQPLTSAHGPTEALEDGPTEVLEDDSYPEGYADDSYPARRRSASRIAMWTGLLALLGIGLWFLGQAFVPATADLDEPEVQEQQDQAPEPDPPAADAEDPADNGEPAPDDDVDDGGQPPPDDDVDDGGDELPPDPTDEPTDDPNGGDDNSDDNTENPGNDGNGDGEEDPNGNGDPNEDGEEDPTAGEQEPPEEG